jgi:hypothetical protein
MQALTTGRALYGNLPSSSENGKQFGDDFKPPFLYPFFGM